MKTISIQRVCSLAGLISLFLVYIILWVQMISTHEERVGADFIGHYAAARIVQQDGYPAMYDIPKQQKVQADVVGFLFDEDQTGYFTHPPFVVPLVYLILGEGYTDSLMRWDLILLALNGLSTFILLKTLPREAFRKSEWWFVGLGAFLFFPTFSGFMNGQDTLFLLLGTSIWLLGVLSGKDRRAGLGLSLAVIRPQMAILLSVPFLFKRRKVVMGFAIGGAALLLFSLVLIQARGFWDYMTILRVVESGMWDHPHATDIPAFSGLLRRTFQNLDEVTFKLLTWGGFLLGLAAICVWWARIKDVDEQKIGLLSLLALFFVPYAHYHELTMLLIPLFCLMRIWALRKLVRSATLALLPVAFSLLTMFGFFGSAWLKYPIVYTCMILMGYFLLFPEKISQLTFAKQPGNRQA